MSVLNHDEMMKHHRKNRNKKNRAIFSESYLVKFTIKRGEYWTSEEVRYFTEDKSKEKDVVERWKKDYVGFQTKFISVIYE